MMTLVIGGAASGKSEYAENLILRTRESHRIYLATMQPYDRECQVRIQRHRAMRAEKGFETLERYTDLAGVSVPVDSVVLLECMSNLHASVKSDDSLEAVLNELKPDTVIFVAHPSNFSSFCSRNPNFFAKSS